MSLALKIQVVMISLVFLSLLAFGWGSGVFVSNQYNQYTNEVIREKLNSVQTEVKAKLGDFDQLKIDENLIAIGTDDGLVQITENGGNSWRKIEPCSKIRRGFNLSTWLHTQPSSFGNC